MKDHISKAEIRKDALQDGVEATTHAVGQVTNILVGAVGDVAKAVGGLATDLFEIREASKRASADSPQAPSAPAPTAPTAQAPSTPTEGI